MKKQIILLSLGFLVATSLLGGELIVYNKGGSGKSIKIKWHKYPSGSSKEEVWISGGGSETFDIPSDVAQVSLSWLGKRPIGLRPKHYYTKKINLSKDPGQKTKVYVARKGEDGYERWYNWNNERNHMGARGQVYYQ